MTETSHPRVTVGTHEIIVSPKHIYLSKNLPATYDYLPWNLIGKILDESGLEDYCLLDIGANVGDSLAHFRRFSLQPAICVEPSPHFFPLLEENAAGMGPAQLVNALVVPPALSGQVIFSEDEQTGRSRAATEPDDVSWEGPEVSLEELLAHDHGATLLKTDTDGFDAELLHGLLDLPGFDAAKVPLIFFEGPARQHLCSTDAERWFSLIERLQGQDYGLLFITNRGIPIGFAGTCTTAARSIMNALRSGMSNGFAICQYFDIIAVHERLPANVHRLASPLDPAMVTRNASVTQKNEIPEKSAGKMTVVLYGAYGTGNLGDDLLLKSALETHGQDTKVVAYGTPFLRNPPNWIDHDAFVADPAAYLSPGDRLIFAGGGLFWAASHADVMRNCAKIAHSMGCDVSIERIGCQGYHMNEEAVKELMSLCSSITVRDEHSVQLLVDAGITDRARYEPDFALVLKDAPARNKAEKCTVGFNHSATPFFYDEPHRRKAIHIYSQLALQNPDIDFVHIPHTRHFRVMAQNDVVYGEYFWNGSGGRIENIHFPETVEDFLEIYSRMWGTIGWRYHLLATSVRMGIPTAFLGQLGGHKYGAISKEHNLPQINFDLETREILGSANRFLRSLQN